MGWIKGKVLVWVVGRLKEPSSWKAIFGLCGLTGFWVAPEFLEYIATGTGAAIAAVEFIRKERENVKAQDQQGATAVDPGVPG